jgi:glycerol uptake facilitator-like aquaporin
VSSANCFFDEVRTCRRLSKPNLGIRLTLSPIFQFIGTFILVFVVFAISDKRNSGLHPSLIPLVIFIVILGIGAAFGMQTGKFRNHN